MLVGLLTLLPQLTSQLLLNTSLMMCCQTITAVHQQRMETVPASIYTDPLMIALAQEDQ